MRLWPRRHGTSLDLLVAGLGNPGREYAGNRHNVGWLVVDELARRHGGSWRSKFDGKLAEIRIDGHKVALLKPETYMNESGRAVGAAMRFFKLEPDSLLVVHDDSDLESGRLQARLGGGLAGHNGLRSVASRLGTPDFLRLRVGVGRPGRGDPRRSPTTFSPTSSRTRTSQALVGRAADAVETLDAEGLDADSAQGQREALMRCRARCGGRSAGASGAAATSKQPADLPRYGAGHPPGARGLQPDRGRRLLLVGPRHRGSASRDRDDGSGQPSPRRSWRTASASRSRSTRFAWRTTTT